MKRVAYILLIVLSPLFAAGQNLIFSGTVSTGGQVLDDVLIDVYEYNSPIKTARTDAKGNYSLRLMKGHEYLLVFYKPGFNSQSLSVRDNRENPISNYYYALQFSKDEHSPEGLYFHLPVHRIVPESTNAYFIDSRFAIEQIKPKRRADSLLVLMNRAQANQYILAGNMQLGGQPADNKYSRQAEENIGREIALYSLKAAKDKERYDSVFAMETRAQQATMRSSENEQLNQITETQRLLAERLSAVAERYLTEQQLMLARARLDELTLLKLEQEIFSANDSQARVPMQEAAAKTRALAANERYRAMDANRKFRLYDKYQVLNYQEYIELLRYKTGQEEAAKPLAREKEATAPAAPATIAAADTSDNLSGMTDAKRAELIREAQEEEARFANYQEKTEKRLEGKEEIEVKDIRIAQDSYEQQLDKLGHAKFFKNDKPITKITFDFETKRRMVDVIKTIRRVDEFGK